MNNLISLSESDRFELVPHEKLNDVEKIENGAVHTGEADIALFPEGGRGWFVVFGCVFVSFMLFGMINAYGVFQTYYETELFPNVSSSKLSIIGACQASITYFITPIALPLIHSFGIRTILVIGSSLMIVAFFGLSTTKEGELWKCYLFQAIFFSVGGGLTFSSVIFAPIEWFKEKRASALGISMCGVGLGGTIWPIIFKQMINKHGFKWTLMTIGFLYIPLGIGAVLFIPQRLEKQFSQKKESISNSKFDIEKVRQLPTTYKNILKGWAVVIKDKRFVGILIANLVGMFGSYAAIFYLDYFATIIAPDAKITSWLIVLYNFMGAPGRVLPAILADRIGRYNVLTTCLFLSGASILAMWIPSIKFTLIGVYIPFMLIFGFTIGPFFSMFPACIGQLFGIVGSDVRLSLFLFTSTPGPILGCLIAGSFIPKESTTDIILKSFYKLTIYSGVVLISCFLIVLTVRLSVSRRIFVFM